ncbi:MAG: DNA repair protein RecO [Gammaproteobacteria bacterium]|jgi:DNA repair protein RecO (recombination protein O)|nr:DNA repair protein RecO [Gammaproteobacteria bacterium]
MSNRSLRRGFVLHRRDYRNTSLLLEVFSAEAGRLAIVAKGAKTAARGRSPAALLLQPFQPLWLGWSGRGEVKTLTAAEAAGPALALAGERLYCGLYLNELMLRLIERDDPHEALFVFYQQALGDLVAAPIEPVLRRFELRLLEELGYAPDLTRDAQGAPLARGRWYRFEPQSGLIAQPAGVADAAPDTPGVTVSGALLARLTAGAALTAADARAARDLMRAALAPHLGPQPLKSRALFRRRTS